MHVSWHLNYLRPHPIDTYKPSFSTGSLTSTHTLFFLCREHINSTHNTGRVTWSNCSCRTCCSLSCHVPTAILSHWLSADWNVQHRTHNLFPAGLTDWFKFGSMNHHSTKLCMRLMFWPGGLQNYIRIIDTSANVYERLQSSCTLSTLSDVWLIVLLSRNRKHILIRTIKQELQIPSLFSHLWAFGHYVWSLCENWMSQ